MGLRWVKPKLKAVITLAANGLNWVGIPMYGREQIDHWTHRFGSAVAVTGDLSRKELDKLCRDLRMQTGQRVDWFYMGGRGVIKCLGKTDHVRSLINERQGIQRYPFV